MKDMKVPERPFCSSLLFLLELRFLTGLPPSTSPPPPPPLSLIGEGDLDSGLYLPPLRLLLPGDRLDGRGALAVAGELGAECEGGGAGGGGGRPRSEPETCSYL